MLLAKRQKMQGSALSGLTLYFNWACSYCVCGLAVKSTPSARITTSMVFSVGFPRSLNDL